MSVTRISQSRCRSHGRMVALFLSLFFALAGFCAVPATAQTAPTAPAPMFNNVDANGVDVTTGQFRFSVTEGSVGSGPGAVSLARYWGDGVWRDNWSGGVYDITTGGVTTTYVDFGGVSASFSCSGGSCTSREGDGATMSGSGGDYSFKSGDGTSIYFESASAGRLLSGYICPTTATNCGRPTSITRPTGLTFYIGWTDAEKCGGNPVDCTPKVYYRFAGVSSSAGYGFSITYQGSDPGPYSTAPLKPPVEWYTRTGVTFTSTAGSCSGVCPSMAYSTSTPLTLTDALGRVWRFTMTGSYLTGIKRPGSASADTTTVTYTSGLVSQVVRDGVTTNYAYATVGGVLTTTVTDANSNTVQVETATNVGRPRKVTDQLSRVTQQTYDSSYRPVVTTWPELNTLTRAYDSRGNVTSTTLAPKPGSGLANIVTSATYGGTCPGPACNKPDTTTDARSHVTNYTYNGTTGQLTSVKLPAPASGGVRPETRYGYAATAGVSMPVSVSACRTTASCAGGADEVKTTISYNSNLLPSAVTTAGGDGVLTASASFVFDAAGNQTYADGPLTGTADTTRTLYDADREVVGVIGPDPDGAGALKNRATRLTFNADGQVTLAEQGATIGQTDSAWTAFASLQGAASSYDANGRKKSDASVSGGTTYSVNQYSYDALGRLDCSAQRMNSAAWGSLPSSACTLQTAGSFGPDRINKSTYDAASQVTKTTSAYGTADAADDATLTYSSNGKTQTLVDADGNKTTYEYDGFDRTAKQRYPSPTTPGTSSTTDYLAPTYDEASNVTALRLRDGLNLGYTFDDLNRRTLMTTAHLTTDDQDVSYSYDLLGRLTLAAKNSLNQTALTYDALGRKTGESNYHYALTSQYDLAGRRTRLTWNDGFYVTYDHLVTGETAAIRENGAASGVGVLATYSYDDLGRRTQITRGNGTSTGYGYDAVSRLSTYAHDLAGTSYDTNTSFGYNPASQITSLTRSNDAYAYSLANQDLAETPNGLNQLTAQGSTALTYDGRGNVTGIGAQSFGYTTTNRLAVTGSTSLYADSLERLDWISTAGLLIAEDGSDIIAEMPYTGGMSTVARRYVFGPGQDEPLVWYEGSVTTDRRWLYQDERGSVVAIANGSGTVTNINKFDDYGVPAAANAGRWGYTGQYWVGESGAYYYKARMYSPGIGRFMQTDPIGYGGGINLYAYVGGDPVNYADSSGLVPADDHCTKNPNACTPVIPPYDCIGSLIPIKGPDANGNSPATQCGGSAGNFSGPDNPAANVERAGGNSNLIIVTGSRPARPAFLTGGLTLDSLPPNIVIQNDIGSNSGGAPKLPRGNGNIPNDYCGGDGNSGIVPDKIGGVDISLACRGHDDCYGQTGASKGQCDRDLRDDILSLCTAKNGNPLCYVSAYIYYLFVVRSGQPFFDAAQSHPHVRIGG